MKKTYGIFIATVLFLSTNFMLGAALSTPSNGIMSESNQMTAQSMIPTDNVTLSFSKVPLFLGLNIEIQNNGIDILQDIPWSFRVKPLISGEGNIRRGQVVSGIIDELGPNELVTIPLRPFNKETPSPLGLSTLYMNASVTTQDSFVRSSQRALLFLFFVFQFKPTYIDIPPAEAYSLYLNDTFDLIIDVVGLDIYSAGHLPGAVNYVWADGTLNQVIPTLDMNLTYLVYCHTDPPSTASAQALVNAGFPNIYRLEGNYRAWVDAGYPIET